MPPLTDEDWRYDLEKYVDARVERAMLLFRAAILVAIMASYVIFAIAFKSPQVCASFWIWHRAVWDWTCCVGLHPDHTGNITLTGARVVHMTSLRWSSTI